MGLMQHRRQYLRAIRTRLNKIDFIYFKPRFFVRLISYIFFHTTGTYRYLKCGTLLPCIWLLVLRLDLTAGGGVSLLCFMALWGVLATTGFWTLGECGLGCWDEALLWATRDFLTCGPNSSDDSPDRFCTLKFSFIDTVTYGPTLRGIARVERWRRRARYLNLIWDSVSMHYKHRNRV